VHELKYICDQNWVKFPSLVFEIRCSQTDTPENRMPLAPQVFSGGGTNIQSLSFINQLHSEIHLKLSNIDINQL